MKLRLSVFLIVISTTAIIGVMHLALNRSLSTESSKTTERQAPLEMPPKRAPQKLPKNPTGQRELPGDFDDDDDDDLMVEGEQNDKFTKSSDHAGLSELSTDDIKKINSIVALSEADLARELNSLKDQIEKEDLFAKLEDGLLTEANSAEAKEKLERFALLGLEGTRRKYMAVEPELKDPLYAYKDSIKEIREVLNDNYENYEDDDDEFDNDEI